MSVLVDEARWWWHGHRFAHLASDRDLDELHSFATALGLRYLAFGRDHYDLPEPLIPAAIERGARRVSSRELVAALRAAGLRRRGGKRDVAWRRPEPGEIAELGLDPAGPLERRAAEWVVRPGEAVALYTPWPAEEHDPMADAFADRLITIRRSRVPTPSVELVFRVDSG